MPEAPQPKEGIAAADEPILKTVDLTRHFRLGGMFANKQVLHAVDDFNLAIREREIVALVGRAAAARAP
jgi:ABC-type glutathione transport system ATPase component